MLGGMAPSRRPASSLIALGVAGFTLAFWGLKRDVGWLAQPFYAYAWWSYIAIVDGVVALTRGGSLLTTRRRLLPALLLWSVSFWFLFELLNMRFQNWYYVGVWSARSPVELALTGLFAFVCFATVFVGLFETFDLVSAIARQRRGPVARELPAWVSYAVQGLGAVMVALAVGFPYWLAPLVWGSVTFLLDPWNYRRGARSLLAEAERGNIGIVARLLAAGMVCGLVWESLNFLAPQKWIYTVRGLEELKLFEMPVLGFLGFPALALDAFAAWGTISYLLYGNRTWEHPDDVGQGLDTRPPTARRLRFAMLPLHVVFWGVVTLSAQYVNVGSVELHLGHVESLPHEHIDTVRAAGIRRPRQLLQALGEPGRRRRLAAALRFDDAALGELQRELELLTHKGIGNDHGRLLRRSGIRSVAELGEADPDALYRRLAEVRRRADVRFPALRPEMVRVWVRAARAEP